MSLAPNYEESHLLVAAVRVLTHLEGRPPTPAEVATLLQLPPEKINVLVHQLKSRGVLYVAENPFEVHLDIEDVAPLEQLPRAGTEPEIKSELNDFAEREREKKAEVERMFRGGEVDKKRQERVKKLEDEFKNFKPRGAPPEGFFKSDASDDE